MKFYMVVNYYLVSLSLKFHEDSCIDARTNVVRREDDNARNDDDIVYLFVTLNVSICRVTYGGYNYE